MTHGDKACGTEMGGKVGGNELDQVVRRSALELRRENDTSSLNIRSELHSFAEIQYQL